MKRISQIVFLVVLALAIAPTWLLAQEGYFGQQGEDAVSPVAAIGEPQGPPEIDLSSVTRVGALTLQPGHYVLEYRVVGSKHFIHFTEEEEVFEAYPESFVVTYTYDAGDANCQLKPLTREASRTAVTKTGRGDAARIARLEIKGETVAHVF